MSEELQKQLNDEFEKQYEAVAANIEKDIGQLLGSLDDTPDAFTAKQKNVLKNAFVKTAIYGGSLGLTATYNAYKSIEK